MKKVIDVRTKNEFDTHHIPNALHYDIMNMMEGSFPDIARDTPIILYCESGNRSMMAKMLMEQAGFSSIEDGGAMLDLEARL